MLFFLCRLVDEAPLESAETEEAGLFGRDHLPALSRNRVAQAQMEQLFRLHESPGSPTVFDRRPVPERPRAPSYPTGRTSWTP